MQLIEPKVTPPLDEGFRPAVLADKNFRRNAQPVGVRAVIGLKEALAKYRVLKPSSSLKVIPISNPTIHTSNVS